MVQSRCLKPSRNVGFTHPYSKVPQFLHELLSYNEINLFSATSLILSAAVSESANVSGAPGRRLEESSSAAGGSLPGLRLNQNSNQAVLSHLMANADSAEPDDDFFDMLVKCQVADLTKYSAQGEKGLSMLFSAQ